MRNISIFLCSTVELHFFELCFQLVKLFLPIDRIVLNFWNDIVTMNSCPDSCNFFQNPLASSTHRIYGICYNLELYASKRIASAVQSAHENRSKLERIYHQRV